MNSRVTVELFSHLCFLFVGIVMSLASIRLGLGVCTEPGPGFLPFGTSVLLSVTGLWGLLKKEMPRPEKNRGSAARFSRRVIGVVILLVTYGFALPRLGYLLSTFLLMVLLFSLTRDRRPAIVLLKAVIVTVVTYLLFEKWLACQLPHGILWF